MTTRTHGHQRARGTPAGYQNSLLKNVSEWIWLPRVPPPPAPALGPGMAPRAVVTEARAPGTGIPSCLPLPRRPAPLAQQQGSTPASPHARLAQSGASQGALHLTPIGFPEPDSGPGCPRPPAPGWAAFSARLGLKGGEKRPRPGGDALWPRTCLRPSHPRRLFRRPPGPSPALLITKAFLPLLAKRADRHVALMRSMESSSLRRGGVKRWAVQVAQLASDRAVTPARATRCQTQSSDMPRGSQVCGQQTEVPPGNTNFYYMQHMLIFSSLLCFPFSTVLFISS
ncbi:uncharacterized protein [Canis lupus baileyi]|uniref:uncharacterized protein n=1 Tax=Canis lupus baileyi TaxID=143281 RepID=UPI003B97A8C6